MDAWYRENEVFKRINALFKEFKF